MRRLLYLAPILLLLTTAVSSLWPARAAAASSHFDSDVSVTASFVDAALIKVTVSGHWIDSQGTSYDLSPASGYYYENDFKNATFTGWVYKQGGDNQFGVTGGCQSQLILPDLRDSAGDFFRAGDGYLEALSFIKGNQDAQFKFSVPNTSNTSSNDCVTGLEYKPTVSVDNSSGAGAYTYVQTDANTIYRADYDPLFDANPDSSHSFTIQPNGTYKGDPAQGDCPDLINSLGSGGSSNQATLVDQNNASNNTCSIYKTYTISVLLNDAYKALNPTSNGTTGGSTGGNGGSNQTIGCDYQLINPLTWIICPIVQLLGRFAAAADKIVVSQLNIKTSDIFCSNPGSSCAAYYSAWQSFRNIALGLMVIGGLVMLIAQALGMELLDAYTIRKVLPRLLIAAVAITVSWPLMQFFVTLSNDLGVGIRSLIYEPFTHLNNGHNTLQLNLGSYGVQSIFGSLGAVAAIPLWIEFGGGAVLLMYLGTASLAIFIAVMVLILRQVAIILLILLAPIAIVSFILPNTQKVYHFWWESFSKALMMFPIIAALLATGRVFSAVANQQAQQHGSSINGLLYGTIAVGAYFVPYFLIPATFKFAGGAIRNLGGFVNDRSRGAFDSLRKGRQEQRQERHKAARTSGLYRKNLGNVNYRLPTIKKNDAGRRRVGWGKERSGSVDRLLNTVGNYTIDAPDQWRIAAGTKGGRLGDLAFGRTARDLKERVLHAQTEHTLEAAKQAQLTYHSARALTGAFGYYYDGLDDSGKQALRNQFGVGERDKDGNLSEAKWKAAGGRFNGAGNEKEILAAASILERGDGGAQLAAQELQAKARTLDSFKGAGKEKTQRADLKYLGMMVAAQDGRLENSELAAYHNEMVAKGEPEQAQLRTAYLQDLAAGKRTSQARKYGLRFTPDGQAHDVYEDPAGQAAQASFGRASAADMGNGKKEEFVDPEGVPSGWSQTIIAATSDYDMETVPMPDTFNEKGVNIALDPRNIDPETKQPRRKTMVVRAIQRDRDGNPVLDRQGKTIEVQKTGQALLDAQAARGKIQSIEGYAQGDTGVGGQIYRIMEEAGISYRYGKPDGQRDPRAPEERPQQPQGPATPPATGGTPPVPGGPTIPPAPRL